MNRSIRSWRRRTSRSRPVQAGLRWGEVGVHSEHGCSCVLGDIDHQLPYGVAFPYGRGGNARARLVEGGCFTFEGSSGCLAHRHRCHPGCFVPFDLEFGAHRQRGEAPTCRDRMPPVRLRGADPVYTRRTDGRRLECRCQLMNHKAHGWIRSSPRSGRRANES